MFLIFRQTLMLSMIEAWIDCLFTIMGLDVILNMNFLSP